MMNEGQRQRILSRFEAIRRRSRAFFASIPDEAYYERPISLRHPFIFYEGHLAVFNVATLLRGALHGPSVDPEFENIFARGIDPETARDVPSPAWPLREAVEAFAAQVDERVRRVLEEERLSDPSNPLLNRAEAVFCILEHEEMHQETLRYMRHQLPDHVKPVDAARAMPAVRQSQISIPAGRVTLGADPGEIEFGWDNEFGRMTVDVPQFSIDRYSVTNEMFLEFIEEGGYANRSLWSDEGWLWLQQTGHAHPRFWTQRQGGWQWRGMDRLIPLPPSWPVYASQAEATAFARWRGMRLPTEAEFHRAAYGTPKGEERQYPWGDEAPDATRGNFDFNEDDPIGAGSRPAGASAWGVEDLVGNGWEWTSSLFAPFPGFAPMVSYPQYSVDFFDDRHFVLKGGSAATSLPILRRTFRNWFRPTYPYIYAKFRCVS